MIGLYRTERPPKACMYCEEPASYVPDVGYLCEACTASLAKEKDMEETLDREKTCFEKARANGEATFTLRAQDITAHVVVEFWATFQQTVKEIMNDGATMVEAVEEARGRHRVPRLAMMPECASNEKERGALAIARAMMGWNNRKLAD